MAGTTVSPVPLWGPTTVNTSPGTLYVAPANTLVTVNRAVFTNYSAVNIGLTVWVARASAGTTTANGQILIGAASGGQNVGAGPAEPYVANAMASLVLNAGDQIVALASTNGLNTLASGWVQ